MRAHYRGRFRRLLLDELQDTNPVQVQILKALFPDLQAWTAVGDPHQSIYGFRRADPRVMAALLEEAQGVDQEALRESRRYHQGLADFHNRFFKGLLPGFPSVEASRPPRGEARGSFTSRGTWRPRPASSPRRLGACFRKASRSTTWAREPTGP